MIDQTGCGSVSDDRKRANPCGRNAKRGRKPYERNQTDPGAPARPARRARQGGRAVQRLCRGHRTQCAGPGGNARGSGGDCVRRVRCAVAQRGPAGREPGRSRAIWRPSRATRRSTGLRRQRPTEPLPADDLLHADEADGPEAQALRREQAETLRRLLLEMAADDREIFVRFLLLPADRGARSRKSWKGMNPRSRRGWPAGGPGCATN